MYFFRVKEGINVTSEQNAQSLFCCIVVHSAKIIYQHNNVHFYLSSTQHLMYFVSRRGRGRNRLNNIAVLANVCCLRRCIDIYNVYRVATAHSRPVSYAYSALIVFVCVQRECLLSYLGFLRMQVPITYLYYCMARV